MRKLFEKYEVTKRNSAKWKGAVRKSKGNRSCLNTVSWKRKEELRSGE